MFLWYSCLMTTLDRAEVGEALRRRRKELGLTLGDVARSMGTSDGYVWKLEQGLINLQNVPLPKIIGLLKVLRWTPEEFTLATGVPLPGLSEKTEETVPGVSLYKVPVYGEEEVYVILGLRASPWTRRTWWPSGTARGCTSSAVENPLSRGGSAWPREKKEPSPENTWA